MSTPHTLSSIQVLKDQPRPNNLKELRSFFCLVNYYREFIPTMSEIALPLFRLTKKGVRWWWDANCEGSYHTFCETLAKEPVVLAFPVCEKPFHLEVVASCEAVGEILSQEDAQGHRRPQSLSSHLL